MDLLRIIRRDGENIDNIVRLMGSSSHPTFYAAAFELMQITLFDHVRREDRKLDFSHIHSLVSQIVNGISTMHVSFNKSMYVTYDKDQSHSYSDCRFTLVYDDITRMQRSIFSLYVI